MSILGVRVFISNFHKKPDTILSGEFKVSYLILILKLLLFKLENMTALLYYSYSRR